MVDFIVGDYNFSKDGPDGPDSKYKTAEWHKTNVVVVKQIPGKGKKFITIRTSDKTLWECTFVQRCISSERFDWCKDLVERGGPFEVTSAFGTYSMYCIDGAFKQDEGFPEPPMTIHMLSSEGGDMSYEAFIGTWTLKFLEEND